MAKIVILGAGLTGLSTAYHLEKKGFFDYKIFEKESEIGGLCRSVFQDGFTFDYTGHLLHINNDYFKSFIKNTVGLGHFTIASRRSAIYSHDAYTEYPFQTNLFGLPENVVVECIEEFVKKPITTTKSYYEWVLHNFGAGFGKHFFFPYQQKIFSYNPKHLTSSWTGRFVPATTLKQIIRGALQKQSKKIGYNATFYYPKKGGTISWIKKIKEQILNTVNTNMCVNRLDCKNKRVHFTNGNSEPFETLVNTIPLDLFLQSLQESSQTNLQSASNKLLCASVINFNLGISRKNLSNKSWIYFPEKRFPFYRIGFPHTFSNNMTPKNNSSLYGEISYLHEQKKSVVNQAICSTKKLFGIQNNEIATQNIISIPHAYVIYNEWRDKNIGSIHQRLMEQNIYSIGRYGGWNYSSMQEAVLDGKQVVENILEKQTKQIKQKKKRENEAVLL